MEIKFFANNATTVEITVDPQGMNVSSSLPDGQWIAHQKDDLNIGKILNEGIGAFMDTQRNPVSPAKEQSYDIEKASRGCITINANGRHNELPKVQGADLVAVQTASLLAMLNHMLDRNEILWEKAVAVGKLSEEQRNKQATQLIQGYSFVVDAMNSQPKLGINPGAIKDTGEEMPRGRMEDASKVHKFMREQIEYAAQHANISASRAGELYKLSGIEPKLGTKMGRSGMAAGVGM